MGQVNRLKIVLLCHFSNPEVRQSLTMSKRPLYTFLRRLAGRSPIDSIQGDIAPWDTALINYFKRRRDVELHIISACIGLSNGITSFDKDNVHYSFVRTDNAFLLKRIVPNANLFLKLNPLTGVIHRLIDDVHPDIVVLVGLENGSYSSAALRIKDYPVLCLCQTIYNNPERALYSSIDKCGAYIERKIILEKRYFGVLCSRHFELLRSINPSAIVFKYGFPSDGELLQPIQTQKKYDFVNFALTLDLRKGAHDSIRAIARLKEFYPHITLNLVGRTNVSQKQDLDALVKELGVEENVVFTPFFEKQSDMFLHIQQARFAVLPCKLDHVSGTMAQAMELGLPLIVYRTSGTPALNRTKPCALIAEKGDIIGLAQHMKSLMENPKLAEELRVNARQYRENEMFIARNNGDHIVECIRSIISNFRYVEPIPQFQLFNPQIDN